MTEGFEWRTGGMKRRRLLRMDLRDRASSCELSTASASATCVEGPIEGEDAQSCASTPLSLTRATRASLAPGSCVTSSECAEATPLSHSICTGFFSPQRFPGIRPNFPVCLASRVSVPKSGSSAAALPEPASVRSKAWTQDESDLRRLLQDAVMTGSVKLVFDSTN